MKEIKERTAQMQPSAGHAGKLGTRYVASLRHGELQTYYRVN